MVAEASPELVLLSSNPTPPRPVRPRRFPQIGWARCTNATKNPIFVYGPHHPKDPLSFDTSLYLLGSGAQTPSGWDAKGILIPRGHFGKQWMSRLGGPLAVKYWDFRHYSITMKESLTYDCPFNNGVRLPGQVNWPIPTLTHPELLSLHRIPN